LYAAFLDELRQYAMKLHTREQAPAEGQAEAPKEQKAVRVYIVTVLFTLVSYIFVSFFLQFVPTKQGYLRFMEESKVVYDAFESIVASDPTCMLSLLLIRSTVVPKI